MEFNVTLRLVETFSPLSVSDMNHIYISKDEKTMLFPPYFDSKNQDSMQLFDLESPHNRWKDVPKKSIDFLKYISFSTWWEKNKKLYTVIDSID